MLNKSIEFNSIHATQRHQQYVYKQIDNCLITDADEQLYMLKTVIANCKKVIDAYGSYAYLMLADAYVHYAMWSLERGDRKIAEQAVNAALKSCELAQRYLEQSDASIHNASLGGGLICSNSFSADTPEKAIEWINVWWESKQTPQPTGPR